jgi:hypothetical protein
VVESAQVVVVEQVKRVALVAVVSVEQVESASHLQFLVQALHMRLVAAAQVQTPALPEGLEAIVCLTLDNWSVQTI